MITKFKLANKEYTVEEVPYLNNCERLGECHSSIGNIKIATTHVGIPVPEDSKEQTLMHEVVHAILDDIGRYDLSSDEVFVQSFSILMDQFIKTKE